MLGHDNQLHDIPGSLPFQSRGVRVAVAVVAVTVGILLGVGGRKFHTTASLKLVSNLKVDWWLFGGLFILYGLLVLARPAVRLVGWLLGAMLYIFFTVAVVYSQITANSGSPVNPVAVGALFVVVIFHVVAAWNASRLAELDGRKRS